MRKVICVVGMVLLYVCGYAQNNKTASPKPALYHPEENATAAIDNVIQQAKAQNKQVLIQAGGNWCGWCLEFNRFVHADAQIDSLLKADYIVYHLNYSKENKNLPVFEQYHFPQRFGFPVFLILNNKGELLHTQNSSYLEEGKSYNKEKVIGFLSDWNRTALDAATYSKQ
jgi:thiol:disulfide interchange protein